MSDSNLTGGEQIKKNKMESAIIKYLDKYDFFYSKIKDISSMEIIYNLFINDEYLENLPNDKVIYQYYAIYNCFNGNYDKMKEYYLKSIEMGNVESAYNLACYYKKKEKDEDKMEKYFLKTSELGDSDGLLELAVYYKKKKGL